MLNNCQGVTYTIVEPGVCEIRDGFHESYRLSYSDAKWALQNIKDHRSDYQTEEAYRAHVQKIQGAIDHLEIDAQQRKQT